MSLRRKKKERDLTQSYGKTTTSTETSKKQRDNTKTPPKTSITLQDGQLE